MGEYRIHIYTGQTSKRGSTATVIKEGYQAPGDAARRGEARESGSTASIAAAMLLRLLAIRSALERRRWTGGREPDVEGLRSSPSADTILQSSLGAPPPLELLYPELCSELLVVRLSRMVEFSSTSSSSATTRLAKRQTAETEDCLFLKLVVLYLGISNMSLSRFVLCLQQCLCLR